MTICGCCGKPRPGKKKNRRRTKRNERGTLASGNRAAFNRGPIDKDLGAVVGGLDGALVARGLSSGIKVALSCSVSFSQEWCRHLSHFVNRYLTFPTWI